MAGQPIGQPFITHTDDNKSPLSVILKSPNGGALDVASYTIAFAVDEHDDANLIPATATGVSKQPTTTVTVDTTNEEWISVNHGLVTGDEIILSNSGGALPTGFAAATRYFVRDVSPHRFKLAYKPNTNPIALTAAGTGTHSYYIVGNVIYQWQSGDLPAITADDEDHKAYFIVDDGSGNVDTWPRNGWIAVRVITAP